MQKLLSTLCGIFLGLAVTGCATVEDPSLKFGLGTLDDDTLRQQFKDEWALRGGNQPTLGLALSGGGTKAGVFAHGVLHGLHDTGLLKEVDVISTVSGGGYAAYWYYSKLMQAQELGFDPGTIFQDCFPSWWDNPNEKPTPDQLHLKKVFDAGRTHARATKQFNCESSSHATKEQPGDPFRWQAHLLRWPDVFRTQPIAVTGNVQTSPTMDFLGQFASLVFELTVGWTGIESNLPRSYQQGLERTWGLNPAPRNIEAAQKKDAIETGKWTYTNALPHRASTESPRVDPDSMRWDKLQALYKPIGAPPLWVLNTTQGDKGDWPNIGNLFELTPFSHGSLRYPHQRTQPPYPISDIATAVRASAAFADSQGLANEAQRSVMNTLAVLVPGARWGVKVKAINRMGEIEEVRLSDGGGADNLGLVSLVRRGLSDVIVVDAAQDAEGLMDDLCWAKVALREEGLTMAFDQLVKFDTNCEMRYPEKAVDKKPLKGMKDDMEGYNVSDWMNAVVHGTVRWPQTGRVTNLWLIKPAWRQTDVRKAYNGKQGTVQCGDGVGETDFNCFLLLYYGHNTSSTVSKSPDDFMAFPQHGTVAATLDSSSYLTLAYRELGRMLASRLQRDTLKKISIKGDHNCKQMPYATRKGRPGPSLQALTEKPTDCD